MFQRTSRRFHSLLSLLDDVLGDPVDEPIPHPHRRPLRWQPERRAGSVASRSAHCLSPVRPSSRAAERDRAWR